MTKEEIDQKREVAAEALLGRSGVGWIYAHDVIGAQDLDTIMKLGLAGSEPEAMVKVALQFAFNESHDFHRFILAQIATQPHMRKFRVRR